MTTANAITRNLAAKGIERKGRNAIYLVLMDGSEPVCFTETQLDTWFVNLSPEQKADLCEQFHDEPLHTPAPNMATEMLRQMPALPEYLRAVELMGTMREVVQQFTSPQEPANA